MRTTTQLKLAIRAFCSGRKRFRFCFMPNRLIPWNVSTESGNPTRSDPVNKLIQAVKKKEVRNRGATSQATRPLKLSEFVEAVDILTNESDPSDYFRRYGMPNFLKFQFHLIARIDDTAEFTKANLTGTDQWDFVLRSRLNWAKNVLEERDAPNQILLGAMDPRFCVLLGLAICLEVFLGTPEGVQSPYVFSFSDDMRIPEGAIKTKENIQKVLRTEIFNRPNFNLVPGKKGSHGVRKLASTHSRRSGATKDEKDIRGRWKSSHRVSDVYDDVDLPFPDAKVAAMLCIGGPCKYCIRQNSGVLDDFLFEFVVPNIRQYFEDDRVPKVLGRALLWMAFSPVANELPTEIINRVKTAYENIRVLPEGQNPVEKKLLFVSGSEGEVYLTEIGGAGGGGGGGAGNNNAGAVVTQRQQLMALFSRTTELQRTVNELRTQIEQNQAVQNRNHLNVIVNLRRAALQPGIVVQRGRFGAGAGDENDGGNGGAPPGPGFQSTLSPHPRSLFLLWHEYEHGIGGRKAAKLFTREERGRLKFKYSRRKVVWDCIAALVRAGLSAQVACDRIYEVYGAGLSVTQIINRMRKDKADGRMPDLLRV